MIKEEEIVGKTAVADGKFYTPKYWVAKKKTDSDVLLKTASKNLGECQYLAETIYTEEVDNDELVYILIQISNVNM